MRFICIGAHPDDCEIQFGGTAALLARRGDAVKFLSVTNGDAGHQRLRGPELADLRRGELAESARRLGIAATEALAFHDGELLPTLEARHAILRQIRSWRADVVLSHRPFDYHPDHRYAGQLVQDSAYLVLVPNVCPDVPPLETNPVYFYLQDGFRKPVPFSPDVAVDIDAAKAAKLDAMDAHASQFYEWLPWVDRKEHEVPQDVRERKAFLEREWLRPITPEIRESLIGRYGQSRGCAVQHAEAFELCEYGTRPTAVELNRIFPF